MSRFPEDNLKSVVYLYPSVDSANKGENVGGTGFVVGVPAVEYQATVDPFPVFLYIVTNFHNTTKHPVVRLNKTDGSVQIIETLSEQWVSHQDGDDIAIFSIVMTQDNDYTFLLDSRILTKELCESENVGIGDEVAILGRFMTYAGKQQNKPMARFGRISMMPTLVRQEDRAFDQESYLVEGYSIAGCSGSSVFVCVPSIAQDADGVVNIRTDFHLLGIDWGHMNNYSSVGTMSDDRIFSEHSELVVKSNNGLMPVVPAWKLRELLDQVDVKKVRDQYIKNQAVV